MCLHAELVGCVSSHHVLNHQFAAGVTVLPCIEAEDVLVCDDDEVAGGDEGFDLDSREYPSVGHFGRENKK